MRTLICEGLRAFIVM